jgi:hypothetical protein
MSKFFKTSTNSTHSDSKGLILAFCIAYPALFCFLTVALLAIAIIAMKCDVEINFERAGITTEVAEETNNLLEN